MIALIPYMPKHTNTQCPTEIPVAVVVTVCLALVAVFVFAWICVSRGK